MKNYCSNLFILGVVSILLLSCGAPTEPKPDSSRTSATDTATQKDRAPLDIRIKYGKTDGGSDCIGKGICSIGKITDTPVPPGSVPVHIEVDPVNPSLLIFTFKKSALLSAGRTDQDILFRDVSHSYNFDARCPLNDPIYAPLQLGANPRIELFSPTNVQVVGDQITLRVVYYHD